MVTVWININIIVNTYSVTVVLPSHNRLEVSRVNIQAVLQLLCSIAVSYSVSSKG